MVKGIQLQVEGEVGSNHTHTHTHTHTYARTHTYLSYLVCYAIEYLVMNYVHAIHLKQACLSQSKVYTKSSIYMSTYVCINKNGNLSAIEVIKYLAIQEVCR